MNISVEEKKVEFAPQILTIKIESKEDLQTLKNIFYHVGGIGTLVDNKTHSPAQAQKASSFCDEMCNILHIL